MCGRMSILTCSDAGRPRKMERAERVLTHSPALTTNTPCVREGTSMAVGHSTAHSASDPVRRRRGHYPDEFQKAVAGDYAGGATLEAIIAKHRVCEGTIKRILAAQSVPLRARTLREDYFDAWTPNSAWLLGYIWADGSVSIGKRGNLRVSFCCVDSDAQLLHDIRRELQDETPVTVVASTPNAVVPRARPQARFRVSSAKMGAKLISLGVVPNKSNTDPLMPSVPDEFLNHFARGVLDGDGSVVVSVNHKHLVQFVGSHRFMAEFVRRVVAAAGVTERVPRADSDCAKIARAVWGGRADALKLLRWMYPPGDYLALARKREKASHILTTYGDP
jgi:hypothetical protein